MEPLPRVIHVSDSVAHVVDLLANHNIATKPSFDGHSFAGDHRIFSTVRKINGKPRFRDGVPSSAMAIIELAPHPDQQELEQLLHANLQVVEFSPLA